MERTHAALAGALLLAGAAAAWSVLGMPWHRAALAPRASHTGHHMAAGETPIGARAADRPATTVRPLACEPLPAVPGKVVTTALVHFPPRAYTPAHRHPGSVSAFVVRGTVRSQLEGDAARTFVAGETWFEPPGILHVLAENPSDEPADVLATFITDEDCGALVIYER